MPLLLFCLQQHSVITACHSALCNSKRWSGWWPAILRQAGQHSQLCPLSQSSSSPTLQSDHSPQTPKRPARRQGIQLTSPSEEMPWYVGAAEGEPHFHPAAHAQSVALHVAYQGCEGHYSRIAVLSLAIAGEFTTVKQIPVNLF